MKLGLGLYTQILNRDNLLFAKQAGATHIIAHTPFDTRKPGDFNAIWSYEELVSLRKMINDEGLALEMLVIRLAALV